MDSKQLTFDPDIVFADMKLKRKKEIITELRGLESHPGWVYVVKVLRAQAEGRYLGIGRSNPRSLEEILEQGVLRGEALGMEILCDLPSALIGMFEVDLKQEGVETEEEDDDDAD